MACPRCGFADAEGAACPRCGVVFAKLGQERRPRPSSVPAPELDPEPDSSSSTTARVFLMLALAGALVFGIWTQRSSRKAARHAADSKAPAAEPPGEPVALPVAVPTAVVPVVPTALAPALSIEKDRATAQALADKINSRKATLADVDTAHALLTRYPNEPSVQSLVTELLLTVAYGHLQGRRYPDAIAVLRRAAALPWADDRTRKALLSALTSAADWSALELYATELVARDASDVEAWYSLGYALFKLDRNREAAEALRRALAISSDDRAQALLARIEQTDANERGMTEQNVSRFHVRYDGDEHVEVGREIVTALERHFATLVTSLDHRPANAIPVILFSRERYHEASGAPIWSGGNFDSLDGRIRVPIGGLTRSLTPGIDSTLMHELVHAFVADKSRGVAPRDIHEGLAQYMEGERLTSAQQEDLVRGRIGGVHGFYLGALGFVEYLIGQRGAGGMNDLIGAMGETGSANAAFRRVYGQDHEELQKAWARRLQQQHGG